MKLNSQPARVLVIDDDVEDFDLLRRAWRRVDRTCSLTFLSDGERALRSFFDRCQQPETLPDLVLLDLKLAGMDGLQILQALREDSQFDRTAIVILSSSRSEDEIARSFRFGANGFISKPDTQSGMIDEVRGICEKFFSNLPER